MGQPCFVFLSANHLKTDYNRGNFYRGILSVNEGIEKCIFFMGKNSERGGGESRRIQNFLLGGGMM